MSNAPAATATSSQTSVYHRGLTKSACVAGLLWSLPASTGPGREDGAPAPPEGPAAPNRLLRAAWLTTLLAHAAAGTCWSVYPERVRALADAGALPIGTDGAAGIGPATLFSWLAFSLSIATSLTFAGMARWTGWRGRRSLPFIVPLGLAGAMLLLSRAEHLPLMVLGFAAVGVCSGAAFTFSMHLSLSDPARAASRCALNEAMIGIGIAAGGIGVGQVAGRMGVGQSLALLGGLLLLTGLAHIPLLRRRSAQHTPGRGVDSAGP